MTRRQCDCENPSLTNLFLSFLKLGATAFGGPGIVPYIGNMAVEKLKWVDEQTFHSGFAPAGEVVAILESSGHKI